MYGCDCWEILVSRHPSTRAKKWPGVRSASVGVETSDFSLPAFHFRLFFSLKLFCALPMALTKSAFPWKCAANKLCTAIVSKDQAASCPIKLTMTQLLLVNINVHNSTYSALLHSLGVLLL
jgi:hypothetical protein